MGWKVREGGRSRVVWWVGYCLVPEVLACAFPGFEIVRRIDVEAKNVVFFNPFTLVHSI
jgi:hypothetical protein